MGFLEAQSRCEEQSPRDYDLQGIEEGLVSHAIMRSARVMQTRDRIKNWLQ